MEPAVERVPWSDAGHYQYRQWADLLRAVPEEPPGLVSALVKDAGRPEYRAYPMLSSRGRRWSIRFEGLQVAVCSAKGGVLDVGKDRADGRISHHRSRWIEIAGAAPITLDLTTESIDRAVRVLREFAAAPAAVAGVQDEHALESRILRGVVPLSTPTGERLELIRKDGVVNWGSQFPTRWGATSRAARYLDGMLKVGRTPWALEMKVAGASGERYYRHAVHQAVLYRDFIRGATPLSHWFDRFNLDQTACEAAVVVPEGGPDEALERLRAVASELGVALMIVPVEHALRPGA